jgi:hypothetical protein
LISDRSQQPAGFFSVALKGGEPLFLFCEFREKLVPIAPRSIGRS